MIINDVIRLVEKKYNKSVIGMSETNDKYVFGLKNGRFVTVNKINNEITDLPVNTLMDWLHDGKVEKLHSIKRREEAS